MSQVDLIKLIEMQQRFRPAPNAPPSDWANYNMWVEMAGRVDASLFNISQVVSKELTAGVPDDGSIPLGSLTPGAGVPNGVADNIEGQWCTAYLDDPAMLGAGALAPVVFTHGLNVPLVNLGVNAPNVRWQHVYFHYGFKGIAAAAAAANPAHCSLHFNSGDLVTVDSIALRVHTNLVIGPLAPLIVEVFFVRAVT